jgi:hypothetical protein
MSAILKSPPGLLHRPEKAWLPEGWVIVEGPPTEGLYYDGNATALYCAWIEANFHVTPIFYRGVPGRTGYGYVWPPEKRH